MGLNDCYQDLKPIKILILKWGIIATESSFRKDWNVYVHEYIRNYSLTATVESFTFPFVKSLSKSWVASNSILNTFFLVVVFRFELPLFKPNENK